MAAMSAAMQFTNGASSRLAIMRAAALEASEHTVKAAESKNRKRLSGCFRAAEEIEKKKKG